MTDEYEAVFATMSWRLRGYFLRRRCDPSTADELTQATLTKAVEKLDGFRGDGPFGAFIYGIAGNRYLNHLRKRARAKHRLSEVDVGALAAPDTSCPAELLARAQRCQTLRACLAELPSAYREILILRYYEQHSFREIAAQLGITPSSARGRARRALQQLRTKVLAAGID